MKPTVSVVIPCYNHWDLTHSLLFDLYKNCDIPDEVIVVDDFSTDTMVQDGLRFWTDGRMLPVHALLLDKNVGFLRAANYGVKDAEGDIIILISTDVKIKDNLVEQVISKLKENPRSIVGNRLLSIDTGWNNFNGKLFPYLEGWLLAFKKDMWNELGGFDEIFIPNDYEDVDFCTKALNKNIVLVDMENPNYTHLGGQSIGFSPERQALTERNREKFRQKWLTK